MRRGLMVLTALLTWVMIPAAFGFNGHVVTEGPLTIRIGPVEGVSEYDKAYPVDVRLENGNGRPLKVDVEVGGLVDEWRVVGQPARTVDVPAGGSADVTFSIAAGPGAFSALYPVHVYARFDAGGRPATAHAVQVFETRFTRSPREMQQEFTLNIVPEDGALALYPLRTHRLAWQFWDEPLNYTRVGFTGAEPRSSTHFEKAAVTRGPTRPALQIHPPWRPKGGTAFVEYRVKLPQSRLITLSFANAVRNHSATEPAGDGVTFRVWVGDERLFERHTDSKVWVDGQVDLGRFAGREILLRLESHPGPRRDTTCDSSFWADPVIRAGKQPAVMTEDQRRAVRQRAHGLAADGGRAGENESVFELEGGLRAAVVAGANGMVDGTIAFGGADRTVVFDGLRFDVLGRPVGRGASAVDVTSVSIRRQAGSVAFVHQLATDDKATLTVRVFGEGPGLRVQASCSARLTDFAIGAADQRAPRVYYGHGYCIEEPKAFRAGFGGHNLSTSHVGFDFETGLSLLMAVDNPPDYLEVNPDQRVYALHTHMDATMTLVPGDKGAFDCAVRYRPLYNKKAAPAFARKAGRFVFDIWGGRYAEIAETMSRMIGYGLTDSLLTVHVWQRWGYDYRLPDIWPPMPSLGTVDDMRRIGKVCDAQGIPWGLHDNYIDFYPDAEGYSYDHICFTEDGRPIKAWLNEGRDAQSYRWRPDRFLPFAKRNLELIRANVRPTHYFIDVFTSIETFDFYDRDGVFHSHLETRRLWGEAFAWIRDYLGGQAVQTSEAGHDQLTGYLEGSDCQHLRITERPDSFCIAIACKDWQRVPWFDAVLHDKFSLHGVGYSSRYQGSRSRREAGIESDDYISAEILTGHALMIDRGAFGAGAVRKYWLAQGFARAVATDTIVHVRFVDNDIHRQIVTWANGARVYVNRGSTDWTVEGRTLPQFGYLARWDGGESSIERIDGVIVERSRNGDISYCNGRGFERETVLAMRPWADKIEYLGGRDFKLTVKWDVKRAAAKDLAIFTHFLSDRTGRRDRIAFQSDAAPAVGTSRWRGVVETHSDRVVRIPMAYGPGNYDIAVGLWDPDSGRRYELIGDDDGSVRYRLGRLIVEGTADAISSVRLEVAEGLPQKVERWNMTGEPVDFGGVRTAGAVRCVVDAGAITVTPLPDAPGFPVAVDVAELTGRKAQVEAVSAMDSDGRTARQVEFEWVDNEASFETRKGEFGYRIRLK
mgnify:CR=1 FL=1